MPTIINNPSGSANGDNSSSSVAILGVILIVILAVVFFIYGLPALKNRNTGGTNINVPDKVDVNVNKAQ